MKTLILVVACLCLGLTAAGAGEKPWFDLENCTMCKNLTAEEGLMENMTWENHVISNGMISITVVNPEYKEAYARAHKKMQQVGKDMMAGKAADLCGFCTSYGGLFMAGAHMEMVETGSGDVTLVTSSDEEVVARIKAHAETTIKEYAKMMEGDHGHGHGDGHGH